MVLENDMTKFPTKKSALFTYADLLGQIKTRIQQGQTRAVMSANAEMISMYWEIGCLLDEQQKERGWGARVIPRLSKDIHNELPEVKGFSERNLKRMIAFYRTYPAFQTIVPQAVAQLAPRSKMPHAVAQIHPNELILSLPWGHHFLLIEKVEDHETRFWYMQQVLEQGWGRDTLSAMIKSSVHKRQGKLTSNFKTHLPLPQSELVEQTLKDPYIFDFLSLGEEAQEREIEKELTKHITKFLLELGAGFSFVGSQYPLEISGKDYYIDLLFYHLKLRCFVIIELKAGEFKPEYTGKLNFYLSAVDKILKQGEDKPSIGIILCKSKDKVIAEYALKDMSKPMGVSEYKIVRAIPEKLKTSLPTIDELEKELSKKRKK